MTDAGKLILRLVLGLLILFHGIAKVRHGIVPITGMVTDAGLPAVLAYGVYIGEVAAPLLLVAGWYVRLGALVIAVNMVVAVVLVHRGELLDVAANGGWALELQAMYLFTALAVALLGPGRYSVDGR